MKFKITLAIAGIAALAMSTGSAVAGNGDKATGGGQTFLGESGKGSTIAFTAQQDSGAGSPDAKGRVTFIDRSNGTKNQVRFHGVVDCIEVDMTFAVIGGYNRDDDEDRFTLRVVDNGEPNLGQDLIEFSGESDTARCGDGEADDPPGSEMTLARGNAQVRDGDLTNPEEDSNSSGLSFLGL